MKVEQISIFLENKSGRLAEVTCHLLSQQRKRDVGGPIGQLPVPASNVFIARFQTLFPLIKMLDADRGATYDGPLRVRRHANRNS